MPIVDIEVVADGSAPDGVRGDDLLELAENLGAVLDTEPGETWVRSHVIPADQYAENGDSMPASVRPVFVRILRAAVPTAPERREEAKQVAESVGAATGRNSTLVHVEYAPEATGRLAFGGTRWV